MTIETLTPHPEGVRYTVRPLGSADFSHLRRLEAEIKRYERRGSTARTRVEREVRKTRTRLERQLKSRRRNVERDLKAFRKDVEKQATARFAQTELVTARVENLVQTGLTTGQQVATKVQERLASVA